MTLIEQLRSMAESQEAYNRDAADDLKEYANQLEKLWERPEESGDLSEVLADLAHYAEKTQKVIDESVI